MFCLTRSTIASGSFLFFILFLDLFACLGFLASLNPLLILIYALHGFTFDMRSMILTTHDDDSMTYAPLRLLRSWPQDVP